MIEVNDRVRISDTYLGISGGHGSELRGTVVGPFDDSAVIVQWDTEAETIVLPKASLTVESK